MVNTECDVKVCEEIGVSILSRYKMVRKFVIGRTACGRDIVAYNIGNGGGLLIGSAFHGMERITSAMALRFLSDVCKKMETDGDFATFIMQKGLTVVPMVNPDGVEISVNGVKTAGERAEFVSECLLKAGMPHTKWQVNACGVDINHNFDAGHALLRKMETTAGITGPAPRQFGGLSPHSEPETKTLVNLCRRFEPSRVYAFHSQGEEIFYRSGSRLPAGSAAIARLLADTSGYTLPVQSGLASHGGFKDWFIKEMGRPGFTIEIGRGKNPLPINELSPIFARLYETLMLTLVI